MEKDPDSHQALPVLSGYVFQADSFVGALVYSSVERGLTSTPQDFCMGWNIGHMSGNYEQWEHIVSCLKPKSSSHSGSGTDMEVL